MGAAQLQRYVVKEMNGSKFVRVALPFWSIEFIMTLIYSHFGSGELSIIGVLVLIVSMVVLPFLIGAKVASENGSVKFAIFGAVLVSMASVLAVAITYLVESDGLVALTGYLGAILIIFVVPQAAFGYVGAFLINYAKAKTT